MLRLAGVGVQDRDLRLDKRRGNAKAGNAWHGHPMNKANNINDVDGNPSHDDSGHEVHELKVPEITRLQEAFVRRVIETVGDLDNVLWESGNECHSGSVEWQNHMIRFVKQAESKRAQQHPVGMTGAPIGTPELMASPADWISPLGRQWLIDPPVNDGTKVILVDTDHCDPWHHDPDWVWKNLFRGNQFILMDADGRRIGQGPSVLIVLKLAQQRTLGGRVERDHLGPVLKMRRGLDGFRGRQWVVLALSEGRGRTTDATSLLLAILQPPPNGYNSTSATHAMQRNWTGP